MLGEYTAYFRKVSDLTENDRRDIVRIYLTYYDGSNETQIRSDLRNKSEVLLVFCNDVFVGFTTLQVYEYQWNGEEIRIVYSGDTIVEKAHWGQQALAFAWIARMGELKREKPNVSMYWFVIIKGHRTYKYLPTFGKSFYPHWSIDRSDLKPLADALASQKFGNNYNPATGIVELPESKGHVKDDIALPSPEELTKDSVKYFLEKNPNYRRGHELVCLCEISEENMKPLTKRIFFKNITTMTLTWQSLSKLGEDYRRKGKVKERQEEWLFSCLERNKITSYGQLFGFEDIRSVEDYREKVPLISYEHISPWVERVASGESDVLFEGLPIAFERTGGSSGGSKLVPYSNESLMDFRAAILPWLADAIVKYGLGNGCAYLAISPATRQPEQTSGGISVGLPDCAYLGDDALNALVELSAVPLWVANVPNVPDWQLVTLYWLVRRNDLEMISVWSPTFFLTLMDGLEHRFSELEALLRLGGAIFQHTLQPDSTALSRLGRYAKSKDARSLWPHLKLVSCWRDASSKSFFDELKHRLPQAAFQGKGLLATEGVVTVPDWEGRQTLATDSGFFEFLDDKGYLWFAHELECGTRYEVVMTTSGGLYRYRTGDCVIGEGIGENLPLLRFIGRRGLVSDMVGEKLTEEFVADCLDGIPGFHMLVPYVRAKPQYVLVMDKCIGIQTEAITISIEESLSRNPQYAYARRMGQLDSLSVFLVSNPLVTYINRVIKDGARLGDVKVPALRPETDWLEMFLES